MLRKANIAFKSDNQNLVLLFPSRLDENIPATHPVRIVNEIVDKLDISDLLSEYKGGALVLIIRVCCLKS